MVSHDPSWLKAHIEGFRGFHPSFENRLGGSYATDKTFGVGLTPRNTGLAHTGFFWWGDKAGPNARRLFYIRPQEIPPGGALSFEMLMRISPNRDWKHLLEPYKQHFTKSFAHPTLGPVHYKADFRPMASMSISDAPSITKDNPYGFHGEARRVDLPDGMKRFCDESLDDVKAKQFYREKMGPEIQTFVEHPCDITLAYSGAYMELNYNEKAKAYGIMWGLDRFWEISQYLLPGAQAAAVSRVDENKLPEGFERPSHYLMRKHIAPFIHDYLIKGQANELKAVTAEFLDAGGQWKQ